jgi:tellurite resistance protein
MKKNQKKCGCACGGEQLSLEGAPDAVMAISILALSADGKLDKREISQLETLVAGSPLFSGVTDAREYMGCISAAVAGKGRDEILEEAAGLLSASVRETAYAWAVYMVAADGRFVNPEHRFLAVLRKSLGLHGVLAGKINAVIPMLNRRK